MQIYPRSSTVRTDSILYVVVVAVALGFAAFVAQVSTLSLVS